MTTPVPKDRAVGRIIRALYAFGGLLVAAVLDHFVSESLATQEKAGHDIGWLGKLIISTPQFWVVGVAFIILLLWCLEPMLRERRLPGPVDAPTAVPADESSLMRDLQQANDELALARHARSDLEAELVEARRQISMIQKELVARREAAKIDQRTHVAALPRLKGVHSVQEHGLRERALVLVSEMLQFSVTALNNTPSHREQPFEVFLNDRRRYWKYQNDKLMEEYGPRLVAIHDEFAKRDLHDLKWDTMPRPYWTQTENAGFIAERIHHLAMQVD